MPAEQAAPVEEQPGSLLHGKRRVGERLHQAGARECDQHRLGALRFLALRSVKGWSLIQSGLAGRFLSASSSDPCLRLDFQQCVLGAIRSWGHCAGLPRQARDPAFDPSRARLLRSSLDRLTHQNAVANNRIGLDVV